MRVPSVVPSAAARSFDVVTLVAYANLVAGLNCRGLGARGGMPTPTEVDQL